MDAKNHPLPDAIRERARSLRQQQPDAETRLWFFLRGRALGGFKFRRQHPVPPYILDFYCHEVRLAIELDGGQHVESDQRDAKRTAYLEQRGIHVIRFWNDDVLLRTELVLESIWWELHKRRPLTPNPSPGGRGA
ncbi:MAG: endonuclease domain-containing protein [Gammaproteobacteria bacterium]